MTAPNDASAPTGLKQIPAAVIQEMALLSTLAAPIYAAKNAADKAYTYAEAIREGNGLFQAAGDFRNELAAKLVAEGQVSAPESKE